MLSWLYTLWTELYLDALRIPGKGVEAGSSAVEGLIDWKLPLYVLQV